MNRLNDYKILGYTMLIMWSTLGIGFTALLVITIIKDLTR